MPCRAGSVAADCTERAEVTVCVVLPGLGWQREFPRFSAVSFWLLPDGMPEVVSDGWYWPPTSLRVSVPSTRLPSLKVTVPAGVPALALTVAVRTTGWP